MSKKIINYINKYNKNNYKTYLFRVRKDDKEILNRLESIDNKNNYIKNLILEDIKPSILTLKEIKLRIKPIMHKYEIDDVYLFGSYARGEANRESDVDIYCSRGNIRTLIQESCFIDELENALGKKVDVVTIGSQMSDYFKKHIEEDLIKL